MLFSQILNLRLINKIKIMMLSRSLNRANRVRHVATRSMSFAAPSDAPPKRVLVSGAAGQIAYSIVYRIAS